MKQQFSVSEIKDTLSDVLFIEREMRETFKDGFQFPSDLFKLAGVVDRIVEVYRDVPLAWQELLKLTPESATEVIEHFALEFDITNEEVEARVENGLRLLSEGYVAFMSAKLFVSRVSEYIKSWRKDEPVVL